MDLRKILIASVVGVVASFAVGIGFYMAYYQNILADLQEEFPNVMNEEPNFGVGLIVTIAQVFLVAMYFDKSNVSSAKSGAINGAWISVAIWAVANGNMMAMTKLTNMSYFLTDLGISGVMGAVVGVAMAWMMGRLSK